LVAFLNFLAILSRGIFKKNIFLEYDEVFLKLILKRFFLANIGKLVATPAQKSSLLELKVVCKTNLFGYATLLMMF